VFYFILKLIMKFLHLFLLKQIIRNPLIVLYIFIYVYLVLGSKRIYIYSCILKLW